MQNCPTPVFVAWLLAYPRLRVGGGRSLLSYGHLYGNLDSRRYLNWAENVAWFFWFPSSINCRDVFPIMPYSLSFFSLICSVCQSKFMYRTAVYMVKSPSSRPEEVLYWEDTRNPITCRPMGFEGLLKKKKMAIFKTWIPGILFIVCCSLRRVSHFKKKSSILRGLEGWLSRYSMCCLCREPEFIS